MSRYKKAILNEVELDEIDGIKPILRASNQEKLKVIDAFKEWQKSKDFDVFKVSSLLSDVLYNSLYEWKDKKRTQKLSQDAYTEDGEEITKEDIESFVVSNVFEVWFSVLDALKILDKKKLKELQDEMRKKQEEVDNTPN